jgi:hypothetical protein
MTKQIGTTKKNVLKSILLVAGLFATLFVIRKVIKLKTLENEVTYDITGKIHSIKTSGILVKMNMAIHNPTDISVIMTKPIIKLYTKNLEIANSKATNETYTLIPKGITNITNIELNIPLTTNLLNNILIPVGISLEKLLNSGRITTLGLELKAVAIFDIDNIKGIRKEEIIKI